MGFQDIPPLPFLLFSNRAVESSYHGAWPTLISRKLAVVTGRRRTMRVRGLPSLAPFISGPRAKRG